MNKMKNSFLLLLFIAASSVFIIGQGVQTAGALPTIAYIGDVEPTSLSDEQALTYDLDHIIPLSPTGNVDAIIFMGDMTKDTGTFSRTLSAISASNISSKPVYFTIGNHEYNSRSTTYSLIRNKYSTSFFTLNYFNSDLERLTFSTNIGNIHIINMNEYWDNSNGDVSTSLYNWISGDLNNNSNYNIVVGHDPLYPDTIENVQNKHVGDSLDQFVANRDRLQNLFVSKNVSVFVGGHVHYASFLNVSGVYHVCTGTAGMGTASGEDNFATITYTHTNNGSLILTQKSENTTWATPRVKTRTITRPNMVPIEIKYGNISGSVRLA